MELVCVRWRGGVRVYYGSCKNRRNAVRKTPTILEILEAVSSRILSEKVEPWLESSRCLALLAPNTLHPNQRCPSCADSRFSPDAQYHGPGEDR
jgi:hypothetical protein